MQGGDLHVARVAVVQVALALGEVDANLARLEALMWARMRTAARVRAAGAWLVLGGMCWPSFPTNWPGPLRALARREDASGAIRRVSCPGRWRG
jgi:hypothetical protein